MPSDGERPWHIPEGELRLRGGGELSGGHRVAGSWIAASCPLPFLRSDPPAVQRPQGFEYKSGEWVRITAWLWGPLGTTP